MDKKHYIKALEKVPGNPQIVINVVCNDGSSEAWGIDDNSFKFVDNGTNLALFQVRTKAPLIRRLARKLQCPSVESVQCNLETALKRWCDKFDFEGRSADTDWDQYDIQDLVLSSLHNEIEELVRLNQDLIRVFGNKEEHKKWRLDAVVS